MDAVLKIPDAFNRFRVANGISPFAGVKISKYVTFVKAKKIIRALTDTDLNELNQLVFGDKLNKFNKWTKDKLFNRLDQVDHIKVMRFLYVREKESLMDCLLCLLNKRKYDYDGKLLTNFFKYGTALKLEQP